jgi:GntR family transcriptional regulator
MIGGMPLKVMKSSANNISSAKTGAASRNASPTDAKRAGNLHPQLLAGAPLNGPLYKEVKRLMIDAIAGGEWLTGKAIPPEWALAERYQVAVGTVRKAVDELVAENILIRQQGRGTFITTHNRERLMFHFFHIVRRDGTKLQPDVTMLDFRVGKADTESAAQLGITVGDPVFNIRNLLSMDGKAIIADSITIPQALFPALTAERFRNRPNTIYHLYQTEFGITVVRSAERLRATSVDAETARLLGIKRKVPVLEIRRVALTFDNAPVEFRRSIVDTENYEYFSDLAKGA